MRSSICLATLLILIGQLSYADDAPNKVISSFQIWLLGGDVVSDDADNGTRISFVGSRLVRDQDLPILLKPYPNLTHLFIGRTNISDAGLKHVAEFKELKVLGLIGTKVTDDGLKELISLKKLERLFLMDNAITDEGLKSLGQLTSLETLLLGMTQITDEGLSELKLLQNLVTLNLMNTKITDNGLMQLSGLKSLREIDAQETKVTEEGVKRLKESLPEVVVVGDWGGAESGQMSGGGQRSDPNFDTSVENPAYTENHPKVLFDEAHDNFHTSTGRYKPFADLITNDGYRITPGKESLTPKLLADFQIVISANAPMNSQKSPSAFTKEECDAVEAWVKEGGSLLLVTDHEPFGSGSQELAKRFGVEMSLCVSTDPANEDEKSGGLSFSREKNLLGNHPIINGRDESERVDRVLTFTGQSLKGPPGSTALLIFSDTAIDMEWGQEDRSTFVGQLRSLLSNIVGESNGKAKEHSAAGRAQGVALEYGKGRVVVMGEAAELSAQFAGQPFGMNTPGCDNRKMVLNIAHWLSHLTNDEAQDKNSP